MHENKTILRIAKNSLWAIMTRGIEVLANLVALAMIARYLGVEDFGIYSFLMAVVWVVSPYLILGLPRILAREISRDPSRADELICAGVKLVAAMSVPMIAGILIFYGFFHQNTIQIHALLLSFIGIISIAVTRIFNSAFVAFEKMKYETCLTFFSSLSFLFLTGLSVWLNAGLLYFFMAFVLSNLIGLMGAIYISVKRFSIWPAIGLNLTGMYGLFRETLPIAVCQFLFQTYSYMGVFILKYFSDNYSVGLFQAPSRIIIRTQVIPMSIMVALFPLLSRIAMRSPTGDEIRKIVETIIKYLLIFSLPFAIIGFTLSDMIVSAVFGSAYLASSIVFRSLILGINLSFMIVVFESLIIALNRQWQLIRINTIALMGSMGLNIAMVSQLDYMGAGMAAPLSDIVLICTYLFFLRDVLPVKKLLAAIANPLFSAVIMASAIYILIHVFGMTHRFFNCFIGMTVYAALLIGMKTFSMGEVNHLKMILRDARPATNHN